MWNSSHDSAVDAGGANSAGNTGSTSAGAPPAGLPPGPSALAEPPPVAPAVPPAVAPAPGEKTAPEGATGSGAAKSPAAKSPAAKSPEAKSPAAKSPAGRSGSSKSSAAGSSSGAAVSKAPGKQIRVELTGYSFYDNTPAGSAEVSNPIVHKKAGGRGTYSDPITVAVPSESSFKPGTRFYLPSVKRYAIVEDSGASSSDGNHLDLWVDGENGSESAVEACMDRLTGNATAEVNPPPGRPVIASPIFAGSCHLPSG